MLTYNETMGCILIFLFPEARRVVVKALHVKLRSSDTSIFLVVGSLQTGLNKDNSCEAENNQEQMHNVHIHDG